MNNNERDEQLQAFFEHSPLDDDMLYLKQFVKDHPDNKMGWYLLGKEYALRDKHGKAKYCFAQSGEVYEAFESKKVKLSIWEEVKTHQTVVPGQPGRRRKLLLAARMVGVLMAATLLGSFWLMKEDKPGLPPNEAQQAISPVEPDAPAAPEESPLRVLYSDPLDVKKRDSELWKKLIMSPKAGTGRTLVVEGYLTSDGKWIDGSRLPAIVMGGDATPDGMLKIAYYKDSYGKVMSQAGTADKEAVQEWVQSGEEAVILRSAVLAYKERYGEALPESLGGMIRDFPANLLPGYTEGMEEAYGALLAEPAQAAGGNAAVSSPAAVASELYARPLEIIVDKAAHRLALVSGSVILRSYPVGLGGDKTPEGVFYITDKVRNPNGRDDGTFGSRGMQLSDPDYAIHGTNEPDSIGLDRSLGCIRMLKADVEELFDMAPSGTKVTIGSGLLPPDTIRKEKPFMMPSLTQEENKGKIYHWLD